MEIHRSARKHGAADEDIVHAASHALAGYALEGRDDEPRRTLLLGTTAQAICSSSSSWSSTTVVGS